MLHYRGKKGFKEERAALFKAAVFKKILRELSGAFAAVSWANCLLNERTAMIQIPMITKSIMAIYGRNRAQAAEGNQQALAE